MNVLKLQRWKARLFAYSLWVFKVKGFGWSYIIRVFNLIFIDKTLFLGLVHTFNIGVLLKKCWLSQMSGRFLWRIYLKTIMFWGLLFLFLINRIYGRSIFNLLNLSWLYLSLVWKYIKKIFGLRFFWFKIFRHAIIVKRMLFVQMV